MAAEAHQHSAIFRRVYPNLSGITRRSREIIQDHAKENKSDKNWTFPDGRTIEFGAVQYEDDKTNWQGRPHDLKAFDELPEFTESQYVFICGWNRSTTPGQRVRILATGNPPLDESGSWIIRRWGPWLDPKHPRPAKPGELRWYATVDGKEQEFPNGAPVAIGNETIYPSSRTFIPARLEDNIFLSQDPHYRSVLQSLPEPLRSMFLFGDFNAASAPDPFQVIPTEWVRLAQKRWLERPQPATPLTAVGIDAVRGGTDFMTLSRRRDNWFDEVIKWPGRVVIDGPTAAGLVYATLGPTDAYINVDVIGVGATTFDHLVPLYDHVYPVNASEASYYRDRSGKLKMRNKRAEMHWRMRDALDPDGGDDLALPNDPEVLADLCAARYKPPTAAGVMIEEKDEIKARIGRSPDVGEAIMLCDMPGAGDLNVF